jgi:RNA polymerase sigma factor (sigma-70 family)
MDAALSSLIEQKLPAAAGGDRDAFARLVDATRSTVASIALAIVRDTELSRDVAQDVFLAAWRDLRQLRDPRSFLPWLRQLTRHRAYHVLRTERRRARRFANAETDSLLSALDERPGADDALSSADDRRVLAAVLDGLPDETREVLTLFYWEGQSTAHVAALLGLSEPAVRKRLSRARQAVRVSVLERFGRAAARSAPTAAFTGAVMTAISVAAPATAAASTGSAAIVLGGSAAPVAKLAALFWSVLLPAAGGIAGVVFGTRQLKRQARSQEELMSLRRFEAASVVLVALTAIAFPLSWALSGSRWSPVVTFAVFVAALGSLHAFWLPQIVAPRHALEMAEDPVRATTARRRERRAAILGWTLGLISGTAGLVAGVWLAG